MKSPPNVPAVGDAYVMGSQRWTTPVKIAHTLDESTRRALIAMAGNPGPTSAAPEALSRSTAKRSPRQHARPAVSRESRAAQTSPAVASKSAAAAQRMAAAAQRRRATMPSTAKTGSTPSSPPAAPEDVRSERPPQKHPAGHAPAAVMPSQAIQPARRTATASPGGRAPVPARSQTARQGKSREVSNLPAWVKRLPAALQYDPSRFRQAVKEMGEQERAALRSEIRRELRLIQNGRLSAEARADASAQARFLLATLSGKAVPIPHARKRPSKLTSTTKTQWHADEDPEPTPTPRFRSVRTYGPSPSKYLLPAYGAPVSGGLPSLGRRS